MTEPQLFITYIQQKSKTMNICFHIKLWNKFIFYFLLFAPFKCIYHMYMHVYIYIGLEKTGGFILTETRIEIDHP